MRALEALAHINSPTVTETSEVAVLLFNGLILKIHINYVDVIARRRRQNLYVYVCLYVCIYKITNLRRLF